jgi:hypothetical protein
MVTWIGSSEIGEKEENAFERHSGFKIRASMTKLFRLSGVVDLEPGR